MKHFSLFIKRNILQFILLQFGNKNTSHLHLFKAKDIFSFTIQMKATEKYFPVVLIIIMLYKGGSNFWVCGWNPKVWPFKWKLLSSTFL